MLGTINGNNVDIVGYGKMKTDTPVPTFYVSSYFDYFLLWYHRDLSFHVRKRGPFLHTRGVGS